MGLSVSGGVGASVFDQQSPARRKPVSLYHRSLSDPPVGSASREDAGKQPTARKNHVLPKTERTRILYVTPLTTQHNSLTLIAQLTFISQR